MKPIQRLTAVEPRPLKRHGQTKGRAAPTAVTRHRPAGVGPTAARSAAALGPSLERTGDVSLRVISLGITSPWGAADLRCMESEARRFGPCSLTFFADTGPIRTAPSGKKPLPIWQRGAPRRGSRRPASVEPLASASREADGRSTGHEPMRPMGLSPGELVLDALIAPRRVLQMSTELPIGSRRPRKLSGLKNAGRNRGDGGFVLLPANRN